VRTCKLARELLGGHKLVKLEVLGDEKTLFPNAIETLKAAQILVDDGFDVMVYTNDDPLIAKELENIGCVAVMPLAAPDRLRSGHPQPIQHSHHHRKLPMCRFWSMPVSAPLLMPPSPWNLVVTAS